MAFYRAPGILILTVAILTGALLGHAPASQDAERPRIGLALSGGGARGFAHIGVLRELERHGVPIDFVAGTSMGSIIGGLYAAGYTVEELQETAKSIDWASVLLESPDRRNAFFSGKDESTRTLLTLRVEDWSIRLPRGVTSGERTANVLSLLTLGAEGVRDFDNLPIPFRALATDLVTGDQVILDGSQMSLAKAIRASISIPGVFDPVTVGDMALVDGGLVKNLPVDVVRAMGADIVIAVDVSTPLRSQAELDSVFSVIEQSISLQIASSTKAQRELADILIVPDIGSLSAAEFERVDDLMAIGAAAAESHREDLVRLTESIGVATTANRRRLSLVGSGSLDEEVTLADVKIKGDLETSDLTIVRELGIEPGDRLTIGDIQERVKRVFEVEMLETASFSLIDVGDDRKRLVVRVRKRDETVLRFGARYNDEDGGVGLIELDASGIAGSRTAAGVSGQFGGINALEAYYFEYGLGRTGFFIRPSVFLRNDFRNLYDNEERIAELRYDTVGGLATFGNTFRNLGEVSASYRWQFVRWAVDVGDPSLPEFHDPVSSFILASAWDTLDRYPYPTDGTALALEWEWSDDVIGSEFDYQRATIDFAAHRSILDGHIVSLRAQAGSSLGTDLPIFAEVLGGGPESLYGFERDELAGNHLALLGASYLYPLAQLPAGVGGDVYLRIAYSVGNAWADIDAIEDDLDLQHGAGVGVGLDTLVGPVDLDIAFGSSGRQDLYLSIGYPF